MHENEKTIIKVIDGLPPESLGDNRQREAW